MTASTFCAEGWCGLESPLLLKEGKARSAGVVLKKPRSAPTKERYASISGGFASLENHPDSLREPPLPPSKGGELSYRKGAGFTNWTALPFEEGPMRHLATQRTAAP